MISASNVDATAVRTIAWLAAADTTIVVPVYQRQYRWDIGGCEQLLSDIRAVSDAEDRHTHFVGSILSSASTDAAAELVLIDGQQRITTIMLLVAALHHAIQDTDAALAAELRRVLVGPTGRTRLRPHREWAGLFENVVLGEGARQESRFDDNYAFFRSQVAASEVPRIWRGLQRLEHVAITLGEDANAQQIFESLNSTGEPLRDSELIHNYVLMGLTHAEQTEIEQDYWLPIEQNTGDALGAFWRHYLVMRTGRELDASVPRGVYDAFRREFPRLELPTLREHAAEWKRYSEIYRVLLDPAHAPDAELTRQLGYVNVFGRGMYPLVMRAYAAEDRDALLRTLESIQSLLLRRTAIGLPTDRLVARLCRAGSGRALDEAFARIMPSDDRMRVALKYGALPHPAYVLGRIAGVDSLADLAVDQVVPASPGDDWTGDGSRRWADYSEDEQNSHRALAASLGNLVLLEDELALRALDASYPVKRALYAKSAVGITREVGDIPAWDTSRISARTASLSDRLLEIWTKPTTVLIDDDNLTPILDAKSRRGWPRGWEREFDYVEYRGEHWEVPDIKYLFNRIFKRLWADDRDAVVRYVAAHGGPVFPAQAWNGQWDALDESHFLYMGWDSRYMLAAVQGLLEEAGIASEVFVIYSYVGNAMPS